MNSTRSFQVVIVLLTTSLMIGCSSGRRTVSFDSARPADINVPGDVQTLLIVDRTKFNKKGLNIVEGVLTGEMPDEDKAATQAWISAFQDQLRTANRFSVKIASTRLDGNSLTSAFPDQLSWNRIHQLCGQYSADAVLAIEIFDTDFIITDGKRKKKEIVERDGEKVEIEVDEFYANGVDNIKIGLRFYNPGDRTILDEQLFKRTGTWEAAASSKADAIAQLITKADATRNLSAALGSNYAYRISPMSIRLTRSFRGKSKKSPALERGTRYADVGNWKQAAEIWRTGLISAREKDAGYFAYNIAVAHEMMGNMDEAIRWAQRSYTEYGNRDGRSYVNMLNRRIENEAIVQQQMNLPPPPEEEEKPKIKVRVKN